MGTAATTLSAREKIAQDIGDRIRRARLRPGVRISQDALAARIGLGDGASIFTYEVGRTEVTAAALVLIAGALDVPVSALLPDPPGTVPTVRARLARALDRLDADALAAVVVIVEKLAGPEPEPEPGAVRAKRRPRAT
ncbi:MAG: hypothetical protein RLY86_856 [Pseudomonadota bacterium]|jgi:transcriptional regulator with XRE-family HTH domain